MKSLNQTYFMDASVEEVFQALTQPEIIAEWSGSSDVVMEPVVGGRFSLWDGDIHGTNLEIISPSFIKQEWFGGQWEQPSIVVIEIVQAGNGTIVELTQENIPNESFDAIEQGWVDYYLGQVQELFADDEEFED